MSAHTFSPDWATHPGEHLAEYLEARGLTQEKLADISGLPTELIAGIVSREMAVKPEAAQAFEDAFGLKACIWMGLQQNWDAHQARPPKL